MKDKLRDEWRELLYQLGRCPVCGERRLFSRHHRWGAYR